MAYHLLLIIYDTTRNKQSIQPHSRFIDSKELKNAFDSLQALIAGSREYSFQDKLNELQDTYKYMLRYRIEGAKDPMQEQIYNNLQASTYELADSVKQKAVAVESPYPITAAEEA